MARFDVHSPLIMSSACVAVVVSFLTATLPKDSGASKTSSSGSGLLRIAAMKDPRRPVHVGLGTDIGGGTSFSLLATVGAAYEIAQLTGRALSAIEQNEKYTPTERRFTTLIAKSVPEQDVAQSEAGSRVDEIVTEAQRASARQPLLSTETAATFNVVARVSGGGVNGQADAMKLGIARALMQFNAELRKKLKTAGMVTRDSLGKHRKKYGQNGARKRFHFSKR